MPRAKVPQAAVIQKALAYAKKAHFGQYRTSGEPYVTHVIAVAEILKELKADDETIAAALLHDTTEDTETTFADLKREFGPTIAKLVEGVTKVEKWEATIDKRERNMQSIRKMFKAMGKDIRVIFIKLADRLHNMRTLNAVPRNKQLRVAQETKDIYCPLAELLGLRAWYQELSDLCFETLHPAEYDLIRRKSEIAMRHQKDVATKWLRMLTHYLHMAGWKNSEVLLEKRHFHRVFERTRGQEYLLQRMETFHRIRIVLRNNDDCYACLGDVHHFSPPSPPVNDLIALPKINGYQALHTSILTSSGHPVHVIIQTDSMAKQAQYGIAMLYQEKPQDLAAAMPAWMETLASLEQSEVDLQTFFERIQTEIFGEQQRVYITGGRRRQIDIPKNSTVLDAAYYAGEKIGAHVRSAFLNDEKVSIKHPVTEGDTLEFVTDKAHLPRTAQDLLYTHTSIAEKALVRQLFALPRKEKIHRGKLLLHRAIDITMDPFFSTAWQKMMRKRVEGSDTALLNVGTGMTNAFQVLEDHCTPQDFFLLYPGAFQVLSTLMPSSRMRYVLRTSIEELRGGNIIGLQTGPDIIEVISAEKIDQSRRFSKEYVPLKIHKDYAEFPLHFALRFTFTDEANPLEGISQLQNLLDTPVKLFQFEQTSVTLAFRTNRLRTTQIAYEYLLALPYVTHIFRITPS